METENVITEYKELKVCSANLFYLISGLITFAIFIIGEFLFIKDAIISPSNESISICLFIQIPMLFALLISTSAKLWFERKEFIIYSCIMQNGVDIDNIKNNYYVIKITPSEVFFCKEEDVSAYLAWNVYHELA